MGIALSLHATAAFDEVLNFLILALAQFFRSAEKVDDATFKKSHAVGDLEDAFHVMRNDNGGDAITLLQAKDHLVDHIRNDGIKTRVRLIIKNAVGTMARAMPQRFLIPPDGLTGNLVLCSSSSTSFKASSTRWRISL